MNDHDDDPGRRDRRGLNNAAKTILIVLGLILLGCIIFIGGCFGMIMLD